MMKHTLKTIFQEPIQQTSKRTSSELFEQTIDPQTPEHDVEHTKCNLRIRQRHTGGKTYE